MGPYKIYTYADAGVAGETHGQSWHGESIAERIALCDCQTIRPLILRYLPPGAKVLESGCGMGRWVFYLRGHGFDVTGIDLAEAALEAARRHDPSASFILDDVLDSHFADESFDAAISLGVLEHFEEGPERGLAELHRTLKPGGLLLVSVPLNNIARRVLVNRLKDSFRWVRRRRGRTFVFEEYRYTKKQFRFLLEGAGFEILEVAPDDFLPPKNMGLYADFGFLRRPGRKWELNALGRVLEVVARSVSPWITCAGVHLVCRKRVGTGCYLAP